MRQYKYESDCVPSFDVYSVLATQPIIRNIQKACVAFSEKYIIVLFGRTQELIMKRQHRSGQSPKYL